MIKCPNPECGHENVDGTQFCEGCGEELPTSSTAAAVTANGGSVGAATVKCPACDNLNSAENVACEVCGAELKPGSAPLGDGDETVVVPSAAPPGGAGVAAPPSAAIASGIDAAPASDSAVDQAGATPAVLTGATDTSTLAPGSKLQPGSVKLVVEQGMAVGAQFILGDREMQVGREDEEEEIYPDIDLSDQDAGYVHRRHAVLRFEDDGLTVTHLGGANKTRINNRPIPDDTPQPVSLGDKVAFGKVVVRVLPA